MQCLNSVLQVHFKERVPADDSIAKNIFRFLEDAELEQAIDNCENQFNLHFPIDALAVEDCRF